MAKNPAPNSKIKLIAISPIMARVNAITIIIGYFMLFAFNLIANIKLISPIITNNALVIDFTSRLYLNTKVYKISQITIKLAKIMFSIKCDFFILFSNC